jgi:hypothetical protein
MCPRLPNCVALQVRPAMSSSPQVNPTPRGSLKQDSKVDKDEQSNFPPQDLGLSPSAVPLRPVHVPDATLPNISSDDMNIGDDPSTSHDHHVLDSQENSVGGSSSDTEPEWSPEDWMADMRRVKARHASYLIPKRNPDPHAIGLRTRRSPVDRSRHCSVHWRVRRGA